MKKHINTILAMAAMLLSQSCEDPYEGINLSEPSHQVIVTSEMDFDNTVQVDGSLTFGDISAGVVSRVWTFPEGVVDIEGSDNDLTSTEANVKTIFKAVGTHEVKLHQVFKDDAFVGLEQRGKELDTTLVIRVLSEIGLTVSANVLNADGTLGKALSTQAGALNEVMAGSWVRYTVQAEGEPSVYHWNLEGGDPAFSSEVVETLDVRYKKVGEFDFGLIASRPRPQGEFVLETTDFLKIVPSTEPVTLDGAQERSGGIALNFSREMNGTTLDPADFSVSITNKGNSIPVSVASATLDPNERNFVVLSLENQTIFNDDKVTVSYTPGELATADGVLASAFSDIPVVFLGENILKKTAFDYSFESSSSTNWPYQWWGAPWDKYKFSISNAQSKDGKKSGYVVMEPAGGMIIGHTDNSNTPITFPAEKGKTYEIGVWVYMEDLGNNDPAANPPDLRFYWAPNTNWGVGPNPAFTADFEIGKWVYSSMLVEFAASGNYSLNIRGQNQGNNQTLKFYMDNISVSEAKLRK
ncbi:hypothetical protein J0A68_20700 [Algoriphagus sp. H41]|uniref:Uncharacterized protein n=1 Tax=Algoriphagus oliviformis TaxID=2811231 RepID=A0ABS3C8H0_9BACT|nr:hypothetical protein [Algoriphagus oliviformis]MBN7813387.1 hypothetical protein [Algoriphagus oliviformis]